MAKLVVQEEGVSKSEKRTLNFVGGTDITVTVTDDVVGNQADIQIDSTAATGSGHTIQDDNTPVTDRANLSFQDGFVVTDDAGGGQTEIDLSYEGTPSTQNYSDSPTGGSAITAARGDHKHGFPAAGSGAPADADYLVGTTQAGLSAEIVVGTSPGGELGGTWSSPTVDAVHSGSAHHTEAHTHAEDDLVPDTVEVDEDLGFLGPGNTQNVIYRRWVTDATTAVGDILQPDATTGRVEPTTSSSDVIIGVALDAGNLGDSIRVAMFGVVQVMWDTAETATIGVPWSTGAAVGQARQANTAATLASHTYRGGWALENSASGTDRLVWCYLNPTVAGIASGMASSTITALVTTAESSLTSEVVVGTTPGGELGGTWDTPTVDATHSGSTHSAATDTHIANTSDAHDASAISILDSDADFTATDVEGALAELQQDNEDHTAAADPHTGYRLESADHTHQSTGAQAGTLDHGLSLTGLTDNDHTQYILHSVADAQGDLLVASAADAFARLALGGNGTVLTSNGTTATWQAPGAGSHPAYVSHAKFGVD